MKIFITKQTFLLKITILLPNQNTNQRKYGNLTQSTNFINVEH